MQNIHGIEKYLHPKDVLVPKRLSAAHSIHVAAILTRRKELASRVW